MKKNNDDDISENKFDVNFIQCHSRYCNLKRSTFFLNWHKLINLVAWNICNFDFIFIGRLIFCQVFI